METQNTSNIALAALTIQINGDKPVPTEIQLLPAGHFRAPDGRPFEPKGRQWFINSDTAPSLLYETSLTQNDLVIDYEHQTLNKEKNGQPAPAAGWFKPSALEWRPESGLWAVNVKWTARAKEYIRTGEYKYISAVFRYDLLSGQVLVIKMASLTNNPGIDGMKGLADLTDKEISTLLNPQPEQQETRMTLKDLQALFKKAGLKEPDSIENGEAALTELVTSANTSASKVAALTEQLDQGPNPEKYVPIDVMKDMQSQLAALTAENAQGQIASKIEKAIEDKLLLPSQKEWAMRLGNSNFAALTEYLDQSKPVIAFQQPQVSPGADAPVTATAALTADEKAIAKAFGATEKEFLDAKLAEQGE